MQTAITGGLAFLRGVLIKTNIYVDGFNLYYGAVKHTPYKWLDLGALAQHMLPAGATVNKMRYFTALVKYNPRDPGLNQRQQLYLRALETIPNLTIHHGHYLESRVRMPLANPPPNTIEVIKREEKGSDVNLASYLLLDAANGDFEQAVVVSNDSDLATPLWMVRKHFKLTAGVWNPHTQATSDRSFHAYPHAVGATPRNVTPSLELRKVSKFQREITSDSATSDIAVCQFPNTLTDAKGSFSKPPTWA